MLQRREGVMALFGGNNAMVIGAVRAFSERGLRVPDDVAVVGFDDPPESEYQVVPLSTVSQDFGTLARLSVDHVVRALEGRPSAGRAVMVPVQLCVRASSQPDRAGGGARG